NVARIAKGFGMTVKALDPFVKDEVLISEGVEPLHSVEELYSQNDIVSLHIPATAQTRNSVNKELISLMPKNAILINTARKEVIDEASLAEALKERTDIKYASDIKPANADELIAIASRNVFFTPKKSGAQTSEANINAGIAAAEQVVANLKDGWNRFQVNK
ncbi:MAG: NAD(P)-dependent oxidoreductase, partial [Bacteroidales bacterium]